MRAADLDTPALTVDLDIMDANIRRMQGLVSGCGLSLRPHVKTHKVPEIAHLQVQAGAVGITCQKLGEAEVFSAAGLKDILITYNIIGAPKLERLTRLARRARVTVTVDSEAVAGGICAACRAAGVEVGILVEVDVGGARTGVQDPAAAVALGQAIRRAGGARLRGLMLYPTASGSIAAVQAAIAAYREAGLPLEVVSGGGTPAAHDMALAPGMTEHRAGTYVFNDATLVRGGYATWDQCALRVLCTVVSRPTPDRAILDGGSKTFSSDGGAPFGHILEYPGARVYAQSEEHGHVDLQACPDRPAIGERVTVVPNHACGCTNLHDRLYGLRRGAVEVIWSVAARGMVQ